LEVLHSFALPDASIKSIDHIKNRKKKRKNLLRNIVLKMMKILRIAAKLKIKISRFNMVPSKRNRHLEKEKGDNINKFLMMLDNYL
jgi:hypothetical protein